MRLFLSSETVAPVSYHEAAKKNAGQQQQAQRFLQP